MRFYLYSLQSYLFKLEKIDKQQNLSEKKFIFEISDLFEIYLRSI